MCLGILISPSESKTLVAEKPPFPLALTEEGKLCSVEFMHTGSVPVSRPARLNLVGTLGALKDNDECTETVELGHSDHQ